MSIERTIEREMNDIAAKNRDALNAAKIQPLSPEWPFCTNGLYLLLATAGCGKSRFIIKHIMMSERLFGEPYYSLICYCSTSGELDKTVSTYINSKKIETPLVEVSDDNLMAFLARHLKRKQKYYAMIEYIRSKFKTVNKTLRHSIDKHKFIVKVRCKGSDIRDGRYVPLRDRGDIVPAYATGTVVNNEIDTNTIEKINKPKLLAWIAMKMKKYNVNRSIVPLLVVLDDFAGHKLIERKETPLAKMMTKCRHYSCTFIIAVQTPKYVIKNIRRQATDIVVWAGLNEEDFFELMKEIQFSYNKDALWAEYRGLADQRDHLILNVKAHSYQFVRVPPAVTSLYVERPVVQAKVQIKAQPMRETQLMTQRVRF